MNHLWGLPLFLLPGSSSFTILSPTYPLSLLCTSKPSRLASQSLTLVPNCSSCPSHGLISNPVHPSHSQRKPLHRQLCPLLSFCQCLQTLHQSSSYSLIVSNRAGLFDQIAQRVPPCLPDISMLPQLHHLDQLPLHSSFLYIWCLSQTVF